MKRAREFTLKSLWRRASWNTTEGILRAIRALDQSNPEFQRQLTSTLIDFGNAFLVAESFEPALDRTREAVLILETLSEENPDDDTLASLPGAALSETRNWAVPSRFLELIAGLSVGRGRR